MRRPFDVGLDRPKPVASLLAFSSLSMATVKVAVDADGIERWTFGPPEGPPEDSLECPPESPSEYTPHNFPLRGLRE